MSSIQSLSHPEMTIAKLGLGKELSSEENLHEISMSTAGTYENDFLFDEDIDDVDFNLDFFPQHKVIKITEVLQGDWKKNIQKTYENILGKKLREIQQN